MHTDTFTRVIQINSQFYQNPDTSDQNVMDKKDLQDQFVASMVQGLTANENKDVKLVIILTHIPPFMSTVLEDEGWANWRTTERTKFFDLFEPMSERANFKLLFVCGHFHTNVVGDPMNISLTSNNTISVDVVVSSAVGTAMWWGKNNEFEASESVPPGSLSRDHAGEVAEAPNGGAAFGKFIMPNFDRYFGNNKTGFLPKKDRSGVRFFKVEDGEWSSEWCTWAALEAGAGTFCKAYRRNTR